MPEEANESFVINEGGGILRTQVWHYPSRPECLACHTMVGGGALGFKHDAVESRQNYASARPTRFRALSEAGYFQQQRGRTWYRCFMLAHATNASAGVQFRARSYSFRRIASSATNPAERDRNRRTGTRVTTPLDMQGVVNGALVNNFGDANNRVIKPGSLTNSILYQRVANLGQFQTCRFGHVCDQHAGVATAGGVDHQRHCVQGDNERARVIRKIQPVRTERFLHRHVELGCARSDAL